MFSKLFLVMTLLTFQSVFCGKLKKKIKVLEENVETLDGRVRDIEGEKGTLEGRVRDLENERGTLDGRVRDIEEYRGTLEDSFRDLEQKIAKLIFDNNYRDWIEHGESIYYVSTETLNWVDAEAFCETKEAMLVIVESQDEHEFIKQQLSTNGIGSAWTAGHDSLTEGSWVWGNPEIKKIVQTFWNPSEPNDHGSGEDCMEYSSGGWNDIPCDLARQFVCERSTVE